MNAHQLIRNQRTNKPKRDRLLTLNFKELVGSLKVIDQYEEPYTYIVAAPDRATSDRWEAIAVLTFSADLFSDFASTNPRP